MLIEIAVHADFLCPWCYLEKRSLETAMYRYKARHQDVEFRVVWKPYLLYPTLRKVDKRTLYTNIMSPEKLETFINGVQSAGTRHGVSFAVHGPTGPSQGCHRLSALALRSLGPAAQAAVVEALFRGHFEHGMDVTDTAWLVDIGKAVGLTEAEVLRVLHCPDMGRELENEVRGAMAGGVAAVPSVLIGNRFRVGGYQDVGLFEGVFGSYVTERKSIEAAVTTMAMTMPTTTATTLAATTGAPSSDWLRTVNNDVPAER